MPTADAPNRVWAVDFQFDATTDGRAIKIVSITDEHIRECLGGLVDRSITADVLVSVPRKDHLEIVCVAPAAGLCRTPSQKYCRATKFVGRPQHLDRCRWKPGRISTISLHHVSGLDRASRVFPRASANPRRGDPPEMVSGDLWKDVYGLRGTRSPPRAEYAQQMCWSSDGDRTWRVVDTHDGQHRTRRG
jgi:hypothetical protein